MTDSRPRRTGCASGTRRREAGTRRRVPALDDERRTIPEMLDWLVSLDVDPRDRFTRLDHYANKNEDVWHELRSDFADHLVGQAAMDVA